MTNTIADIETADVILITGSNTSENHPVISTFIKRAVKFNGAKVIVVDPRRIKMTEFATHWLRPNLGTDVAWINGLMHVIINEKMHDPAFIEARTEGFDAFAKLLEKYTPSSSRASPGSRPKNSSPRPNFTPAPRTAVSSTVWASPSIFPAPTM